MINKEVIKMQKRTLWVIGFCLSLLALSACTWVGQPAALEEVISSADCTAPCWRGITPGVTTFAEAQTLVQAMQDPASGAPMPAYVGVIETAQTLLVYFDQPEVNVDLHADSQGLISDISFNFEALKPGQQFKLGEMIARFGEPDALHVCHEQAEVRRAVVRVVYPQIEMTFEQELPSDETTFSVAYTKNTRLNTLTYYAPRQIPGCDFSAPWAGYGEVSFSLDTEAEDSGTFCPLESKP